MQTKMAILIKDFYKNRCFLMPSTTNQQFPIVPNEVLVKFKERFEYSFEKN